ncbi:MAG: ECF transporter S component [Clostridia bacterium]|nr:ECF transporter S component [Clostridia bacterium]
MTSQQIRKLTYAALYLAIALVLPFITGQIPEISKALSPMHIPVLLCGFMCGWPWGMAVGFIAPLLRGFLFGMPVLFPSGIAMAFELAVYGAMTGYLYSVLPRKKWITYAVLIIAMIAGRLVWGLAHVVIAGFTGSEFTFAAFLAGAVTGVIPGIILHIALIPVLVIAMERAGLSLNAPRTAGR